MCEAVECRESNHEPVLRGFSNSQQQKHAESDKERDEHWFAFIVVHFKQPFAVPQLGAQRIEQTDIEQAHQCNYDLSDALHE
jgi:hypothetical protein